MRKMLCVARREYLSAVQTKGFLISLVAMPLLMFGSLIAIALLKDQVDTTDKRIAVVDRSGLLSDVLTEAANKRNAEEVHDKKTGKKARPAYLLEVVKPNTENPAAQRLELSDRVRSGNLHAFVEIGTNILHPDYKTEASRINYHAKNAALDDIRRWMGGPVNEQLRKRRLAEAGIDEARIRNLFDWTNIESMGLVSADVQTGEVKQARRSSEAEAVGVPMVMMMLMFLMVMMSAVPLLNSVMEEKMHRIAEILLGSVAPFPLMFGKIIGGVGVAITGASVYVAGGIFTLTNLSLTGFIPYHLLPWFIVYLVLVVLMLGSTFAAAGAACSDPKDAQSLTLPAMLPVMIPMFLIGPILKEPNSTLAIWMSLIPPFTPMLMMMRLSLPSGVPAWQPWVGLAGVVAFTLLAVWASGRVFRVGLLIQGKSPRFADMLRWIRQG